MVSAIPTLLMSGGDDPVTPTWQAERAAESCRGTTWSSSGSGVTAPCGRPGSDRAPQRSVRELLGSLIRRVAPGCARSAARPSVAEVQAGCSPWFTE